MKTLSDLIEDCVRTASGFLRDRRGNVALITAVMAVVLCFAAGMGIDYTLASSRRSQLNGIADAAALAAVTPTMMTQSSSVAKTAATNVFSSQVGMVNNITYSSGNLTVTVNDVATGAKVVRTAVVTYTAGSNNIFATLLGMSQIPIGGSSTSTSTQSPNTDFYLLLDDSPSMGIAATTAGINTMVANTQGQCDSGPAGGSSCGCAFGCHEQQPGNESHYLTVGAINPSLSCPGSNKTACTCQSNGNNCSTSGLGNPSGEDNYTLAKNLGVTLRMDLVNQATQNLMSVAQTTAISNNTTYRAAIYTMDYNFEVLQTLTSNLSTAQTSAANLQQLEVYDNNCLTSSSCNSDEDSYLDAGLSGINSVMPNPGNGTSASGDTPQEVLMVVSDGLNDELNSGSRAYPPISTLTTWCSTIKARNIRIAFLYLTYNPLPTNGWYNSYISSEQSSIATAASNCASTGLYFQVNTDGDVSSAMATLFQEAVATARLSS